MHTARRSIWFWEVGSMRQHNVVDDYLSAVCRQIRWKKAHGAVAEEIRDHINDQIEVFIAKGTDEAAAAEAAIREMGDPVETGTQLDRVHRPKTDWPLLAMTALMVVVGLILRSVSIGDPFFESFKIQIGGKIHSLPIEFISSCGPALIALAVFLIFYFTDIIKKGWVPAAIYIGLTGVAPIISVLAGVAGDRVAYYLQYLLLPVPIAVTALFLQMKLRGYPGLVTSLLLFAVPAADALLIGSTATCVVICASCLAVLTTVVFKGFFNVHKVAGLAIIYAPFVATALIFIKSIIARIQSILVLGPDPLNNFGLRYSLAKSGLTTGANIVAGQDFDYTKLPYYDDTNNLNYLIIRFGWIIFIFVAILVILFTIQLIRNCSKQRNRFGLIVSIAVTTTILAQAVIYIAANLGFMLFTPLTLPLLSHGGLYLILNVAMLGVLLSVYRTDSLSQTRVVMRRQDKSEVQVS